MKFWFWKLRYNLLGWRYDMGWNTAKADPGMVRDSFEMNEHPNDAWLEHWCRE